MYLYWSWFLILLFILFILFLNFNNNKDFENKTFFECGFESIQTHRSLFSLRFFSLTIIFLIFDMEIMFILPLTFFYLHMKLVFFFIYFLLLFGTYLEWNQGGLMWK